MGDSVLKIVLNKRQFSLHEMPEYPSSLSLSLCLSVFSNATEGDVMKGLFLGQGAGCHCLLLGLGTGSVSRFSETQLKVML